MPTEIDQQLMAKVKAILEPTAPTVIGWYEYSVLGLIAILCFVLYGLRRGMDADGVKRWFEECRTAFVTYRNSLRAPHQEIEKPTNTQVALRHLLLTAVKPLIATGWFDEKVAKGESYFNNLSSVFVTSVKVSKSTKYIGVTLMLLLIGFSILNFFKS